MRIGMHYHQEIVRLLLWRALYYINWRR